MLQWFTGCTSPFFLSVFRIIVNIIKKKKGKKMLQGIKIIFKNPVDSTRARR